ncbi:MAG: ATP-dependent Clp protease ATP-binding subunit [Bacteroidales bacterium]
MNNNFTDNAKEVITNATNEATRLKSSNIDTGHLILGMLRIKSCIANQIISKYVDDLSAFKDKVETIIRNEKVVSNIITDSGATPLSENVARILKLAALESASQGSTKSGTKHILAAILMLDRDNSITKLLLESDVNLDNIRDFDRNSQSKSNIGARFEIFMQEDDNGILGTILKKRLSSGTFPTSPNKNEEENEEDDEYSTRYLDNFGKDLSLAAEQGKLDPIIGREDILERVTQILSRRKKNNPIIVGEAGVGKSAIAEGLALHIAQKKVPYTLQNKRIFTLDLASVVAGTKYRGQFEERLKGLIMELQKNPNLILFIDEIHTMIGAGNVEGGLDASNIFKPALARGEIQCIGATTNNEYRKHFESDSALERRFQKVLIEPTTQEQTIEILHNIKSYYESYHKVKYSDESIVACVKLTDRYINDRFQPDKAIDALDEAGARTHVKSISIPEHIATIKSNIEKIQKEKKEYVKKQMYEQANATKNQIAALQDSYIVAKQQWEESLKKNPIFINEDDIARVISSMTGITIEKTDKDETKRLLNMEEIIKKKVIGQDEATSKVCKAIKRARTGLKDPNRPIGSFIFVGPTGVGKTYLAKILADYLFGSKDNIIRIDMSEYMEKFNVSRLIGSAPGYVGYEESGQLTEQVRLHPYSIVLFDEIEKAHKEVFNILLQILDEGRLTDSMGRTVDFKNTIIIMTSNVGSRTLKDFGTGVGFSTSIKENNTQLLEQNIIDKDINKTFSPEFLNRIDDIVFFNTLNNDDLLGIVDLELDSLRLKIEEIGYKINISKGAKQFILDMDNNRQFGARPIKRVIQKVIENPLSELILANHGTNKRQINIKMSQNKDKELKIEIV